MGPSLMHKFSWILDFDSCVPITCPMAQPQNPSPRWFLRRDHFVQGNAHGPGHSPNKHLPGILRINTLGSTRVLILRTTHFFGIT